MMKYQASLKWLVPLIGILALIAAGAGLFDATPGAPYAYTNHRGETVMINGSGLYFYDSVSSMAQMQANDLITLIVGLPLLVVSYYLAGKGSLRGQLLLTGTLGFFLYTYMSMAMLTSYNNFFLLYVVLFGLSLYAFILAMLSFELVTFAQHFSQALPHTPIAILLFAVSGFLGMAWIGRILGDMQAGQVAQLENTTTRVIQAMDLVLIAPAAILGGIFLLRRHPVGYLLASVLILKAITMGLAVSTMALNMVRMGVPDSAGIIVPFLVITVLNLIAAGALLKNITD